MLTPREPKFDIRDEVHVKTAMKTPKEMVRLQAVLGPGFSVRYHILECRAD